jgi:hypothetical protein
MNRAESLAKLLTQLKTGVPLPNVFNPWGECDPIDRMQSPAEARLSRLAQHFDVSPRFILVGEAPGFKGCHFSGIPFADEKLILDREVPRVTAAGRLTTLPSPLSEDSSKRVWQVLKELKIEDSVVLWNAFPWHPHYPGHPCLNRTSAAEELRRGLSVLREVRALFPEAKMIPVGNRAEDALKKLCVALPRVPHPANRRGGMAPFRNELRARVEAENHMTSGG